MKQHLEEVRYKQQLVAIVVHSQFEAKEHQFLTPKDNPFQLGLLQFAKGQTVKAHVHNRVNKTITENQEFLYVVSGKVVCSFYWELNLVKKLTLIRGDCLLQISGGHSFTFLETSKLITIKQGPYLGVEKEKKFLQTA